MSSITQPDFLIVPAQEMKEGAFVKITPLNAAGCSGYCSTGHCQQG